MEGEKEQLQGLNSACEIVPFLNCPRTLDRLQLLAAKLEDAERRVSNLSRSNNELYRKNQSLDKENQLLKSRALEADVQHQLEILKSNKVSIDGYSEMEFKLAETRAKLARTQQVLNSPFSS